MASLPNEQELVDRSRQGDLEAFNVIVLAYQDRVYNLCLRMMGSQQPAEDATQEAFISAYRHIDRMRGPSLRSWLLRIASNACIDELRRRKRRQHVSLDAPHPEAERSPAFLLPRTRYRRPILKNGPHLEFSV